MSDAKTKLLVPARLISFVDLSRVVRELDTLDDALRQASIRNSGQSVQLPRTTQMLEDTATINGLSLLDAKHREVLLGALKKFQTNPPLIHMSFTVEPSAKFVEKMITWLRANIKDNILLEIGLQPTIVAGCVVRTQNKVFDMSLRANLSEKRDVLVSYIAGGKA